ncbi:MAG: hypothetical protein E7Z76_01565 [Methanobrevibacter sp.]|nr:hypothetical protein [Methanobrevibacter sp.]
MIFLKIFKFSLICFILFIVSLSFVCAEDVNHVDKDVLSTSDVDDLDVSQDDSLSADEPKSYQDLANDIKKDFEGDSFNLSSNYKYGTSENDTKFVDGFNLNLAGGSFTIDGKNHFIDADGKAKLFNFANGTITIKNLHIKNVNFSSIVIYNCTFYTNNVTFENNHDLSQGGAVYLLQSDYFSNNDKFINNSAKYGSDIFGKNSFINIDNSTFTKNGAEINWSLIYGTFSDITINNCIFTDLTSKYATVVYNDHILRIKKSKFTDIHSELTAGAVAVKGAKYLLVQDSEFINVTSGYNGGAVYADIHGDRVNVNGTTVFNNTLFKNCYSFFGGAVLQLGGYLNIIYSNFTDNAALLSGGAVYASNTTLTYVSYSKFDNNSILSADGSGGALFLDNQRNEIKLSQFNNNSAYLGAAIYLYDSYYELVSLTFSNNTGDELHTYFDRPNSFLRNLTIKSKYVLNDKNYPTYVLNEGKPIVLNRLDVPGSVSDLYFNLNDLGLVTKVKNQGSTGSCWAFGATGALESAFLIATNITLDISENNMKGFASRYSIFGKPSLTEGGYIVSGLAYYLSWLGVINSSEDKYDELGKISPVRISPENNYHILEAVILNTNNRAEIKEALLKYGALTIFVQGADPNSMFYNPNTYAVYCNNASLGNHFVTLVGWNDTYSKDNFNLKPAGDGAWIVKNSWGEDWGDNGYFYLSYYDEPLHSVPAVGYVINNTIVYNNLYQYDVGCHDGFITKGKEFAYANYFNSSEDNFIAAVGTYFMDSNVDYTIVVYINGNEVYYQKGKSAFGGYNTIKLNKLIAINKDDQFGIEIQTNGIPLLEDTRQHFLPKTSICNIDGTVSDLSAMGKVAVVKAYTLLNTNITKNIKQYFNASNFVIANNYTGANITIYKGLSKLATATVADGKAIFNLTLDVGNYTMITSYDGSEYVGAIEILPTILIDDNIKIGYNVDLTINCQFIDTEGIGLANNTVINGTLNGNPFTLNTTANGLLQIVLSDLKVGNYVLSLKNPVTGEISETVIDVVSRFAEEGIEGKCYYLDGSSLTARIVGDNGQFVGAGEVVIFQTKKGQYRVITDANGYVNFVLPKILTPGKHKIKATYNGESLIYTVKVKQVLKTSNVKVKKSAKKMVLKAKLVNKLKGKKIIFKFNGKKYAAKTNKKGVAAVKLGKKVIKKLKAGKKYAFKVAYSKDVIKGIVKVKK